MVVASLIGIISNGFDAKVAELRKGRSRVLERDHTQILGGNSKIFQIFQIFQIVSEDRIIVLAAS